MSELYSQQEISEMLKELEFYKVETIVTRKELQIEKAISQNRAEAYSRMNALNYDLNLHINETNKQLENYKKALDMMSEELAMNKHCKMFPNCYLESDQENCQLIKECHDKEWLKQYYIEKASEEE